MNQIAHKIPARERVIVALDVPDLKSLGAYLDRLDGQPAFYKIGLELFMAGEYFPLLYTRAAVEQATQTRIHLVPGASTR